MSREDTYIKQLQALEIYDPAFDPAIKNLARLERELTRAQKEWSRTAEDGGALLAPERSRGGACGKGAREKRREKGERRPSHGGRIPEAGTTRKEKRCERGDEGLPDRKAAGHRGFPDPVVPGSG